MSKQVDLQLKLDKLFCDLRGFVSSQIDYRSKLARDEINYEIGILEKECSYILWDDDFVPPKIDPTKPLVGDNRTQARGLSGS